MSSKSNPTVNVVRDVLHKLPFYKNLRVTGELLLRAYQSASTPLSADFAESFNGQVGRRKAVSEIFRKAKIEFIVETGTFKGDTTSLLSSFGKNVVSSELSWLLYWAARRRLANCKNVSLFRGDCRQLLARLSVQPGISGKNTFFYLDAHWYDDLPLRKEIDIIASVWDNFIILIDDFHVPGDEGYGFDDYGGGKRLDIRYIGDYLERGVLDAYFPAIPSAIETGARRGYVFLTRHGTNQDVFSKTDLFVSKSNV